MVVVAIIATLASIAVPTYTAYLNKARVVRAIADIKEISRAIDAHKMEKDACPATLYDVGYGNLRDPWGHSYQYFNIATAHGNGALRKDRFLVPINSDYDLYSMGADGQSSSPLTARPSRDDIIRANDGGYVGLASLY
jgi:general secretion pathway protein G